MIRFTPDMDLAGEFISRWNKKLRSIRIYSYVISILMILFSVLCFIFPMQTVTVIEGIVCILLIALGIYQMMDYFHEPVWFRYAGGLVSGIFNVILGILLLASPKDVTISTFAFLFGWAMMLTGIEKISFGSKLNFFAVTNCGWVTVSGILNIVASLLFIFIPLASTIALNYILAVYLLVGGVTLLIEAAQMKDFKVQSDQDVIDV